MEKLLTAQIDLYILNSVSKKKYRGGKFTWENAILYFKKNKGT